MRARFNRRAREYDQHATIQLVMANRLVELIERSRADASPVRRILEIGCGTGLLTKHVLATYPQAHIRAVDIAEQMIRVAQARVRNEVQSRVAFVVADAECMDLDDASFDLIVSNATVQWFNDPVSTIQRLLRSLTADGTLAFATFGPDTFFELHRSFECAAQRLEYPPLRRGQTYLSAQDWSHCSEALGHTVQIVDERRVLSFSTVRSFLASVRSLGAANASESVSSYPGKSIFPVMEDCYRKSFSSGDRVLATYHILYVLFGRDVTG